MSETPTNPDTPSSDDVNTSAAETTPAQEAAPPPAEGVTPQPAPPAPPAYPSPVYQAPGAYQAAPAYQPPHPYQAAGAYQAPVVAPAAQPAPPAQPAPQAPSAQASTSQPAPPTFSGPAASPSAGFGADPTAPAAPKEKRQRGLAVPLAATAVVAALLGGGAGAGVAAWAITTQGAGQTSSTAGGNQTITVNNPDKAQVVTAVAAKAAPSVVTISVAAGSGAGSGSGVILSDDGYVLTNTHVVTLDGASADGDIEVTTFDGRIFSARVVGLDPIVDLAVLKLTGAENLTPIEWGDSDKLNVGEQVIAIGAPLGLANTVTDGIVSALERSIQVASAAVPEENADAPEDDQNGGLGPFDFWNFERRDSSQQQPSASISIPVIQTDAAINPGNSGGALVDGDGRLVGINVAIASTGSFGTRQSGSIGVGFAIPSTLAQRVADEIIETGTATHGLLGASVTTATSEDSAVVGAVIREIVAGGAAEAAQLRAGDVVTGFGGKPITSSVDLTAQVRSHAAGSTVELEYQRDGKATTVEVTLGSLS